MYFGSSYFTAGMKKVCLESDKLTPLQRDFLEAFFARESRFFLTGGAALAGFYLRHRETKDLDLFTSSDALEDAATLTTDIARDFNASLEAIQTSPDFRRFLLRREADAIVIDLVRDRVPQIISEKPVINGIRIDPPEEILANKLCALLSRSEIRDLIDVRALEMAGYGVENAVSMAALKDRGLTPAQLAWVLNQIEIANDFTPPGDVSLEEIRQYLKDLVARLTALAFPR